MSIKQELRDLILSELNREITSLIQSARAAHEAATHEESKAEDAHDTRGLEASYLAGAQSARVEALKRAISIFQGMEFRTFQSTDQIGIGALVELESQTKRSYFLLVNLVGGKNISYQGKTIQLITPQSPMGEAILDRKTGDTIEVEGKNLIREYRVISVL